MDRRSGDSLRLVATFAVLCIHTAGSYELRLVEGGPGGWQANLAATLSQLSRFSVPVFMILSGYGLASSRLRRGEGGLAGAVAMWRRQFLRIGLPFLAFTIVGLFFHQRFVEGGPGAWSITLLEGLLTGGGDYHLYFCAFLLQGYLVLPLLYRSSWSVVGALLLLQLLLGRPGADLARALGTSIPHVPAWWCVHWLGYMALGCRLARRDAEREGDGGWRVALSLLAAVAGAWCVADYLVHVRQVADPGWVNHFFRACVVVYSLLLLAAWRAWGQAIAAKAGGPRSPGPMLARLTGVSFTVYLIHPTVLRGLSLTPLATWFPAILVALILASFAIACGLSRVVPGRWLRLMLGLPAK